MEVNLQEGVLNYGDSIAITFRCVMFSVRQLCYMIALMKIEMTTGTNIKVPSLIALRMIRYRREDNTAIVLYITRLQCRLHQ